MLLLTARKQLPGRQAVLAAAASAAGTATEERLSEQVVVVLGTQWGDEGKGKLVDILAQQYDVVARAQVPCLHFIFQSRDFCPLSPSSMTPTP